MSSNIGSTRFTVSGTDSGQVERTLKEVRTDYAIIFKKLQSKEYINITDNSPTIKNLEDLLKECNSIHPKDGTLQILKEQIERLKVVVSTDWGTMKVKIVGDQTTWGNTTPLDNQSLVVWLNHTPGTEKFLTIKTKDSKGDLELNLSECKNGIAEKFHEFILNNLDDRYRNIVLSMRETVNITPVQQHEIELLKENISKYIKDNPSANTTVLSQLRSNVESLPNQIVDRLVVLKKYKEYCDAKFSSKFKSLTDSKVSQLNEQVAKAVAPRKVDENYRFLAHMLKTTREELRGFKRGGPIELTVDVLTTINIPQPVIKAFGLAKRINDGFVFSEDVCQYVQKLTTGQFYIVPIYVSRADSKTGHAMLMKIECTDTNSLGKKTYLITHFNTGDGVNEDNNHYRKTLENGANIYQLGTQVSGVSEDKLNQKFFEQVMNTSNQSREDFYRTLFSLGERSPPSNDPNLWGASQGLSGTCETSAIKALMRSVLTPEEYVLFELKAKTELLFRDIKVLKQGECDKTTEKIIALDAVKNISAYFEGETIGWLKELEQTLAFDEIVAKHKEGKDENLLGALSNLYSNVNGNKKVNSTAMKLQSTLKEGVDQTQIKNIEKLMKEVSKGKLNKLKYVIVSKFLEIAKSKYLSDDSGVSRSPQSSQQSTPQSTPPTTPEEQPLSPAIQKELDEFLKARIEQLPKEEDRQSCFIGGIVRDFCDGKSLSRQEQMIITMKVLDFYYL